jgi:hypothetical protein
MCLQRNFKEFWSWSNEQIVQTKKCSKGRRTPEEEGTELLLASFARKYRIANVPELRVTLQGRLLTIKQKQGVA